MPVSQLWGKVPEDVQREFDQRCRRLTFKRGEVIYRPGDLPAGIYFIESGLVGLVIMGSSGAEHLLRFFKKNQYFGHRSLFAEEVFHAQATAIEPVVIYFVPKQSVFWAIERYPQLQAQVIKNLAIELGKAESRMVEILESDVMSRVARTVVYLKEIYPHHVWTRQEMANFCSSTVSTVIKTLAKLEQQGFIRQEGRQIEILDRDALLSIQDQ